MPRSCTICGHPDREAIDQALVAGTLSNRRMASHYDVTERAVRNHKANHLPASLAKAQEAEEVAQADELLGQMQDLQKRTLAILEAAEDTNQHRTALAAIREARSNLELLAKLLGELDERPTVNLLISPEWLELRAVIVAALEPHPDALRAVVGALEAGGNGKGQGIVSLELRDDLKLALDRAAFARTLGLEPDPWQERLLRSTSDRVLLNCCRQSGKSTMTGIIALHRALYHPRSLILCLAPALRQSQELFGKVLGFYRDLGRPIPAQAERKLSLELENNSRIVTLPGTDKTVRGFSDVALLIVDEASRVADELYFAVRPMLAVSGGGLMMLTTPYGKRGVFFEEWTDGAGWERYEVPAEECPRIREGFLEEEREALPGWVYRQEYECSFEDTEDVVFTHEMVERAVSSEVTPLFGSA